MRLIEADRGTVRIGETDLTSLSGKALRAERHRAPFDPIGDRVDLIETGEVETNQPPPTAAQDRMPDYRLT